MESPVTRAQAAPTASRERIFALDALRGVAVLGILLMNITDFGLPHAYSDPSIYGGATGADLWAWIVTAFFLEGTMRGLFTILFGAGVVLFTSRLERAGVGLYSADLFFRRNMWLMVFGLFNAYVLLFGSDILFPYGVCGMFLYVFRHLRAKTLLLFAVPLLCVNTVSGIADYSKFADLQERVGQAQLLQAEGKALTEDQQADLEEFKGRMTRAKPPQEKIDKTIAQMRGGWSSAYEYASESAFFMESEFFYTIGFWECFGMMMLGMALFKSGALTAQWSSGAYWTMLIVGWGIGLTVNGFETAYQLKTHFDVTSVSIAKQITYDLGRIPLTLGHLAFIMLVIKSGLFRGAMRVLASTGQMALTNYLAQSLICLFVFTGVGFALFGQLQRHQLYYVVFAIWAVQLAWSPWWLARHRFGPMEWLWRSLTRWEKQPLRRGSLPAAE